jgi:hypothetical protein
MNKFIVGFACFVMLAGCSSLQINQNTANIINTAAVDVGYVCARSLPEAHIYLEAICALNMNDPDLIKNQLNNLLGKIWTKATSSDVQIVALTINNLIGLTGLNTSSPSIDMLKNIITNICKGAELVK